MKTHLLFKIGRIIKRSLGYLISVPITILILILSPIVKIRFVSLFSDRIGHYALNTELMLCALDKDIHNKKIKRFFYTAEAPICNEQLHKMWQRVIYIIPYPLLASQVDSLLSFILKKQYTSDPAKQFRHAIAYQDNRGLLEQHPPHLFFTPDETKNGDALMQALGVPKNKRYVCILARDSQYLNDYFPANNWSYHNYRDANITNYKKAALFLAEQGYYVVRMGKSVATKFDVSHPNVIDYANHALRSDFLDIYLSAHCDFFISTASGLDAVPQLFRRPVVLTNIAPINGQLQYWFPCFLFIYKKLKDKKTGKLLDFHEIEQLSIQYNNLSHHLDTVGLEILENTEDEILELIKETIDRLNNNWNETDDMKYMHHHFNKNFPITFIHDRKNFNPETIKIKLGYHFLKKI